jgi:hypothetical protein
MKKIIDGVLQIDEFFTFVLAGFLIIAFIGGFSFSSIQEKKVLENEVAKLLKSDSEYKPAMDPWGNVVDHKLEKSDNFDKATIRSAGPDGIKFTKDDIIVEKTDINKSRVAGEWVGEKSKEVVKGLFSGLFK